MEKKSQIAIFILFSIVILIAFSFIYFLTGQEDINKVTIEKQLDLTLDRQAINSYFNECARSLGEDSLFLFGLQGGNMELSRTDNNIALLVKTYYENGENVIPTIEELEEIYSEYVEQNLPSCLEEFEFPGYQVESQKPNVNTKFYNNFVDVDIEYPLTFKRRGSEIKLMNFDKKFPVRMGHIYDVSYSIVNKFVSNPKEIEYSHLMSFEENTFFIIPYNENLFVILMQDDESVINNKNFNFIFGLVFEDTGDDIVKREIQELLA